jgi:transposase
MTRRLQMEWQEDEATLKRRYLAEKDPQDRTRLQALWQLRRGLTTTAVAELVGKHPRTIQDWIAWYRQGGLEEVLRHRHGGHGGKASRLAAEQLDELKAAASAGQVRRIEDRVQWAQEQHGVSYTYWGMRSVFERLGLRKKVPRPRNPKASAEQTGGLEKGGAQRRARRSRLHGCGGCVLG